jgi:hypothetical protein
MDTVRKQTNGRLYVLSAGFGLLAPSHAIPSYSATFARGEDQVAFRIVGDAPPSAKHRAWWAAVNEARHQPSPLCNQLHGDVALYALGQDYLQAISEDLTLQVRRNGPERVWVIACRARAADLPTELADVLLPVDTKVESLLPGTRSSSNARVLDWLVREALPETGWCRADLHRWLGRRLEGLATNCRRAGLPQTDEQVSSWLREQLAHGKQSAGALLRSYRRAGFACEQSRFGGLVRETVAAMGWGSAP